MINQYQSSIYNKKTIEIGLGETLNIKKNLTAEQEEKLVQLLRKYKEAFAWDYPDMKGIDPQLYTHHIYIENDVRPIRQPQWRLNPHLKDIMKAELQKILYVNFTTQYLTASGLSISSGAKKEWKVEDMC